MQCAEVVVRALQEGKIVPVEITLKLLKIAMVGLLVLEDNMHVEMNAEVRKMACKIHMHACVCACAAIVWERQVPD